MKFFVFLFCTLLLNVQCSTEKPQQTLKEWSSTYRVDSGVPVSMVLTAYETPMLANGNDQTLIRATAFDSTGEVLPALKEQDTMLKKKIRIADVRSFEEILNDDKVIK